MMVARPTGRSTDRLEAPDETIPMKSSDRRPDEVAVFFKDGVVVETMGPGRYTLDSLNLPFLSNLWTRSPAERVQG